MLRKAIAGLAALVLLCPMVVLVSVGLLVNPSACLLYTSDAADE